VSRPAHLVLGAGCAGLSLALALVRAGVREEIVIVDRRTGFGRDRTWCFWDVRPTPFSHLASARWPAWSVVTGRGTVTARSARHLYLYLDSRDVYAHALAALDAAPNVKLALGTSVTSIAAQRDGVTVQTSAGELRADRAYDALAAGSPRLRGRPAGAVELRQTFVGQVVETARPAFDPGRATLMDFRVAQDDGLRFMYVLPFSPTRALVEDTSFAARPVPAARRRAGIAAWLGEHAGVEDYGVEHEEAGTVPMTTHPFAAGAGPRLRAVGIAGGAARPSSGYAFVRIQAQCAAVAAAVAADRPAPAGLGPWRRRGLDVFFLRALARDPGAFPGHFARLAARVPGDVFARFMTDASSPADDARVVAALAGRRFVAAGLRPRG
jgi:lycopene beta-cyclase